MMDWCKYSWSKGQDNTKKIKKKPPFKQQKKKKQQKASKKSSTNVFRQTKSHIGQPCAMVGLICE